MDKFTDQYFTYRETPVDYDGVGNITRIKGNTLVWNQLLNVEAYTTNTSNGITFTKNSNNTISITGTATGRVTSSNFARPQITNGHKYLLYLSKALTNIYLRSTVGFTASVQNSAIFTATADGSGYFYFDTNATSTATLNITNLGVCLFDLTLMYGSGSEPTADEFVSIFSSSYYPYDSGSLLSFNGTGIKTTGKNLIKLSADEIFSQQRIAVEYTDNGAVFTANGTYARAGFTFETRVGETYTISFKGLSDGDFKQVYLTNEAGWSTNYGRIVLSTTERVERITFTATSDVLMVGFYVTATGTTGTMTINELQLEYGSAVTGFVPFTSSTTDLPVLTYFPTGLKSAGSVYDELTPSKAITRVGSVDLGTLTWTKVGAISMFYAPFNTTGQYYGGSALPNILGSRYTVCSANTMYGNRNGIVTDDVITINASFISSTEQRIVIADTSYSDASALQSALSGVYLNYELATESEQDINIRMIYPIYADGTEQILPTSDTSPFFGDIEYYNGTEGETNIRKFWLINGENERWDLTEKDFKAFLNNPQGLGFRKTVESVRYGERQNKVSETYNFPQPQGELLFYDSYNSTRYDKYNKFIRFLMNQPITLYYMIPVSYISGIANIYTLDCEVTEVQKTESKTDNILRSSIVFNGMEFYKGDPITVNGTGTSYTLTNEGDFPVGFEITIEGNLTNPYVTLSQDGELYGEAKFDSSTAFNSVYVNSNDGEQNVILEQGGSIIPNPLSYQDLSISNGSIYVTFVKLARGESELSIGSESGTVSSVKIEFTPMYRSV